MIGGQAERDQRPCGDLAVDDPWPLGNAAEPDDRHLRRVDHAPNGVGAALAQTGELPRPNRFFMQPTPDRAVADARHQTRARRVSRHIGHAESTKWQAQGGRHLVRERLDLNGELWGEKPEGVPGGLSLRGPPIDP